MFHHDEVAVKVISIDRDQEFDQEAMERFRWGAGGREERAWMRRGEEGREGGCEGDEHRDMS